MYSLCYSTSGRNATTSGSLVNFNFYISDATVKGFYEIQDTKKGATIYQIITDISAKADTPMEVSLWLKEDSYVVTFASDPLVFLDTSTTVCRGGESIVLVESVSFKVDLSHITEEQPSSLKVKVPPFQTHGTLLAAAKRMLPRKFANLKISLSYDSIVPVNDEDMPIVEDPKNVAFSLIHTSEAKRVHPPLLNPTAATATALTQSVQLACVRILVMHRKHATADALALGRRILSAVEALGTRDGSGVSTSTSGATINACKGIVLKAITLMTFEAGHMQEALKLSAKAIRLTPKDAPSYHDIRALHARSLLEMGNVEGALRLFGVIISEMVASGIPLGKASSDYKGKMALAAITPYLKLDSAEIDTVGLAKFLPMANRLVREALIEDPHNFEALAVSSKVLWLTGTRVPAVELALHSLLRDVEHKGLKANIGWMMKAYKPHKEAIECFKNASIGECREEKDRHAPIVITVMCALAAIARDEGLMELSLALYSESMELEPLNFQAALGFFSCMLYSARPHVAVTHIFKFLLDSPALTHARITHMHFPGKVPNSHLQVNLQAAAYQALGIFKRVPIPSYLLQPSDVKAALSQPWPDIRIVHDEHGASTITLMEGHEAAPQSMPPTWLETHSGSAAPIPFLDTLVFGIFFVLVKCLFAIGRIDVVNFLVSVFGPLKKFIAIPLSKSIVANEAAYFWCIAAACQYAVRFHELPEPDREELFSNYIYCFGDSHILSVAWQPFVIKGKKYLSIPLVATGLKIWHLRKESTFYPRVTLSRMAAEIPKGSKVLICIGELDIRESLLRVVDGAKYKSIKEAIAAIIVQYDEATKSMAGNMDHMYVMYPPPILPETRSLTNMFWKALDAMFAAPSFPTNVTAIPTAFALTADGYRLKDEYVLDGTHLAPSCVKEFGPYM